MRAAARAPVVAVPEALAARFPEDREANEMGLDSYLAVCLRGADGRHLGHLAVLDGTRMEVADEDVRRCASSPPGPRRSSSGAARRPSSPPRARASSRRPTPSAGASGATCTTARSSACSPCPTCCASRGAAASRRGDPAERLLDGAAEELDQAHADLRELARGLYPVALAERGLPAALASWPRAARGRGARRRGGAAARGRRLRRVLHGRGVPGQRGAARAAPRRRACASRCATGRWRSRSADGGRAAPTSRPAPACAGWPTAMAVLGGRLAGRVARRRGHARARRGPPRARGLIDELRTPRLLLRPFRRGGPAGVRRLPRGPRGGPLPELGGRLRGRRRGGLPRGGGGRRARPPGRVDAARRRSSSTAARSSATARCTCCATRRPRRRSASRSRPRTRAAGSPPRRSARSSTRCSTATACTACSRRRTTATCRAPAARAARLPLRGAARGGGLVQGRVDDAAGLRAARARVARRGKGAWSRLVPDGRGARWEPASGIGC